MELNYKVDAQPDHAATLFWRTYLANRRIYLHQMSKIFTNCHLLRLVPFKTLEITMKISDGVIYA